MAGRHILDFRAGAPWSEIDRTVFARSLDAGWGNPLHPSSEGRRAAIWVDAARATVRALTGYPEVEFFPNRDVALRAVLDAARTDRVAVAATQRSSVLDLAAVVANVDETGIPTWPDAVMVIAQAANEETGVIDPAPRSGRIVLDATSSFARTEWPGDADTVIADAGSWGAPAGLGMVLGRTALPSPVPPPVPLIAVAVARLEQYWAERAHRANAEQHAMQRFETRVRDLVPDVQFHGVDRVAHVRSLSVLHLDAETLMRALDARGYVVGSGSACVADGRPSHVLAAMGRITHGNIRLALPVDLDLAVLDDFSTALAETVQELRREAGVEGL